MSKVRTPKVLPPAQVIITVDRDTRQISVEFKNFEGVPPMALDRVDMHIEKALYMHNLKARQEVYAEQVAVEKELREQAGSGRVNSHPRTIN